MDSLLFSLSVCLFFCSGLWSLVEGVGVVVAVKFCMQEKMASQTWAGLDRLLLLVCVLILWNL